MTVKQMLACLDAYELIEWQAFFAIESEDAEQKVNPEQVSEQLKADMMAFKR